jgi:hypothetical protein
MKTLLIISLLLIVTVSSCKKSGTSEIGELVVDHVLFTLHDNKLLVQVRERKDSIAIISLSAEIEKDKTEAIEIEYFYDNQKIAQTRFAANSTMGQTMVVGGDSYDYCHAKKPEKDYVVCIYSVSELNGTYKRMLLGEVKFLNPKNGIFEQIVMLKCLGIPVLRND